MSMSDRDAIVYITAAILSREAGIHDSVLKAFRALETIKTVEEEEKAQGALPSVVQ